MVSKTVVGIAAGIAGTLFLGYCIYFDRKRRSDPLFRRKLKERREKQKNKQKQSGSSSPSSSVQQLPNMGDPEAIQQFFLTQVQHGEELLAQGDLENGTLCLCHAVAVCGQPAHLLEVLQRTLPSPVYNMLIEKLPPINDKIQRAILTASGGEGRAQGSIVVEEVE